MSKLFSFTRRPHKVFNPNFTVFDQSFIERNIGKVVVVVVLLLASNQMRYVYEGTLTRIGRLERQLNDVRYTSIEKFGLLAKTNLPSEIRRKITDNNLELTESDEPPVVIP